MRIVAEEEALPTAAPCRTNTSKDLRTPAPLPRRTATDLRLRPTRHHLARTTTHPILLPPAIPITTITCILRNHRIIIMLHRHTTRTMNLHLLTTTILASA